MASIIARTEVNHHHLEKFSDLYIMDKVWAAKRIWRERIKSVEVTTFQEALLESGLREFHESQDKIPGCADVSIGFASVMAGECFEKIGELTDELIHNDLLVRTVPKSSFWLLTEHHLIASSRSIGRRQFDRIVGEVEPGPSGHEPVLGG